MTKKANFLLISVLYIALLAILYIFTGQQYIGLLVLAPVIFMACQNFIMWRLYEDSSIKLKSLFVSVYSIVGLYLLALFPSLTIYPVGFMVVGLSLFLYIILLSINIYIISEKQERSLPLLQPARLVIFMAIIIEVFIGSTIIYKLPFLYDYPRVDFLVKTVLFAVLYAVIFLSTKWFHLADKMGEVTEKETMAVGRFSMAAVIILSELAVILCFFPFEAFGKATLLAATAYVLMNTINAYLMHRINIRYLIESASILIVTYLLIYFL